VPARLVGLGGDGDEPDREIGLGPLFFARERKRPYPVASIQTWPSFSSPRLVVAIQAL